MSFVYDVLALARTHLNDDQAILWPDHRIIPKFKQAQYDLHSELTQAGLELFNEVSVVLTVPLNSTDGVKVDLSTVTNYPTNLIEPIFLEERRVGQTESSFVPMTEYTFSPNVTKGPELLYWEWRNQTIFVPGATEDTEVRLKYKRRITIVSNLTDTIEPLQSESFLAYKTAGLCLLGSAGDQKAKDLLQLAASDLDRVLRFYAKGQQNKPVRRRGYQRNQRYQSIQII